MKTYRPVFWHHPLLILLFLVGSSATTKAEQTCSYAPSLAKSNPLGMRACTTTTEELCDTPSIYEQILAVVDENITVATKRKLVFYETSLSGACALLLQNKNYPRFSGVRRSGGLRSCQPCSGLPLGMS